MDSPILDIDGKTDKKVDNKKKKSLNDKMSSAVDVNIYIYYH